VINCIASLIYLLADKRIAVEYRSDCIFVSLQLLATDLWLSCFHLREKNRWQEV